MKRKTTVLYTLSRSDMKELETMFDWCIHPYVQDNKRELKIANLLKGGTCQYLQETYDEILDFLHDVKNRISSKKRAAEREWEKAPVSADGIILKPKDFWKYQIDNFETQIKSVDQIVRIFIKEDIDENEEGTKLRYT